MGLRALQWAAGLALLQGLLTSLVVWLPSLQAVDERLVGVLALADGGRGRATVVRITELGAGRVVGPLLVVTSLALLFQDNRLLAASQWGGFLAARAVTDGLKQWIARPRPLVDELGRVSPSPDTLSFPSGHATSAVFLYGFLAMVIMGSGLSRPVKGLAVAVLVLIALSVSVSRVLLGVHFPSDVIGGLISGGIGLAVAVLIAARGRHL